MISLGIDAAWTAHHASGVAIVDGEPGAWRCRGAFSSYAELFQLAGCEGVLQATESVAGALPDVVAVDMPLSRVAITGRRACDNMLSRAFGSRGCGVHSPSPSRPGAVGERLMAELTAAGYELAVNGTRLRPRQIIEVYPHAALLSLLGADYRVPYKIGRIRQYWRDATREERLQNLRANLTRILEALRAGISDIPIVLPPAGARTAELKRFEDALDGIVCAWIGAQYLDEKCRAYGDEAAAMWVPDDSPRT